MRLRHLSGSEPARGARDSQRPASGLLILLATVTVAALTLPDLPPDVCFDDPGDLQAAACHLGIAHPPGYAAYCAAGWARTRIAPVSPPRAITLACWATALAALLLAGVLMQVVGVPPVIAASFVLLLAAHPNVHENLLLPEVYAPTAALLLLAVLCLHH